MNENKGGADWSIALASTLLVTGLCFTVFQIKSCNVEQMKYDYQTKALNTVFPNTVFPNIVSHPEMRELK